MTIQHQIKERLNRINAHSFVRLVPILDSGPATSVLVEFVDKTARTLFCDQRRHTVSIRIAPQPCL